MTEDDRSRTNKSPVAFKGDRQLMKQINKQGASSQSVVDEQLQQRMDMELKAKNELESKLKQL